LGWKIVAKLLNLLHLLPVVKALNRFLRLLTAWGHRLQFTMEWVVARHPPEWFDHFLDNSWKWHQSRNPLSWERGVFGSLAMQQGCRVLDLCCGGGFITYHFFSGRAASVVAVDFDPKAIAHARRNFKASNLVYRCADIRTDMPEGEFDNVSWDAAIEHFTETEIAQIIGNIKQRLTRNGVLSGYTIIEKATGNRILITNTNSNRKKIWSSCCGAFSLMLGYLKPDGVISSKTAVTSISGPAKPRSRSMTVGCDKFAVTPSPTRR